MPAPLSPRQRLLSCAEALGLEEEQALANQDWPALAELLERELAVLARLGDAGERPPREHPADSSAARRLEQRLSDFSRRIEAARAAAHAELSSLGSARRRMSAVREAYRQR